MRIATFRVIKNSPGKTVNCLFSVTHIAVGVAHIEQRVHMARVDIKSFAEIDQRIVKLFLFAQYHAHIIQPGKVCGRNIQSRPETGLRVIKPVQIGI